MAERQGWSLVLLVAVLVVPPLRAQGMRSLDAQVTFASGRSVFLDQGRDAGVVPGNEVILRPPGQPAVKARIESVSRASSRAEITEGVTPPPGVPAEILIAASPPGNGGAQDGGQPSQSREHPPWKEPVASGQGDLPLLAPAFDRPRRTLPTSVRGRVYGMASGTVDRGSDRESRYLFTRAGLDLTAENLLGARNQFDFAGEVNYRRVELDQGTDLDDTRLRLDRAAYQTGLKATDPLYLQLGRFPRHEVPELGVLDGAEMALRMTGSQRLGVAIGFLPDPFDRSGSIDDISVSVFHRLDLAEKLQTTIAYEKTWHEGQPDRDLLLLTADGQLAPDFSWRTAAWIDFYMGDDRIKSHGAELTEIDVSATWRIDAANGLAGSVSQIRWPELLREDFASIDPQRIADNQVLRTTLSGWHQFSRDWRFDARGWWYGDNDADGLGGDARLAARDLFATGNETAIQVRWSEGTYLTGPGMRVSTRQGFGSGAWSLAYDVARQETRGLVQGRETFTTHALIGTLDFWLAPSWDISFGADARFGDGQESLGTQILVQYRF